MNAYNQSCHADALKRAGALFRWAIRSREWPDMSS